jgi:hypothetical protein
MQSELDWELSAPNGWCGEDGHRSANSDYVDID